jgi:hypothetical protein
MDPIIEYTVRSGLIEYVKSTYEHTLFGIDYLFYPASNPKRLYILCNGATVGKYTMWSWFWRDDELWDDTAYLFLKDDAICWYLGTAENPLMQTYSDLIRAIMHYCTLTEKETYIIGHSMGGYAALHFGLHLGLAGVFALRPQIDWQSASTYFSVKKLKNVWIDLDTYVMQSSYIPKIYLQFGEFGPDKEAGNKFLHALITRKAFVIVEKTDNESHTGYHPTKEYIEATLAYMEQIKS